jgi:hypothetical protein
LEIQSRAAADIVQLGKQRDASRDNEKRPSRLPELSPNSSKRDASKTLKMLSKRLKTMKNSGRSSNKQLKRITKSRKSGKKCRQREK